MLDHMSVGLGELLWESEIANVRAEVASLSPGAQAAVRSVLESMLSEPVDPTTLAAVQNVYAALTDHARAAERRSQPLGFGAFLSVLR